jgi:hypothetical protein
MQFYGIFFMRPYNQSGRCQDVFDNACTILAEDGTLGCSKHVEDTKIKSLMKKCTFCLFLLLHMYLAFQILVATVHTACENSAFCHTV